jgi:predicted nucleotidyltransferase
MEKNEIIAKLRAREAELRAAGIASLSVFGSVARGDAREQSDIDVIVRLKEAATERGFAYFGQIEDLSHMLADILGRHVDVIAEPVGNERLRQRIEKDRTIAF